MWILVRRMLAVTLVAGVTLPQPLPACADEADDQFAVAAGHYDRQRWQLAVEEFQTFLQKYPNDPRANRCVFYLGEALLQLNKLDDARRNFHAYVERDPEGKYARAALFRSGESAYLAGKLDAARPDLESFLAKYPDDRLNAYVLPYLGEMALAKNETTAAAGYFRDGLKRFPEGKLQDDCRVGLARALEKQNQLEEAERLYLAVAGKPARSVADAAQFHLGALQYAAGRYQEAAESFLVFKDRWAESPWQPNARLAYGLALLKLNRPADAAHQFDIVLGANAAGDELLQQALRGKVQAALQMKDYAALDREAAQFEAKFSDSRLKSDVQRMVARSLVERQEFVRALALLEPVVKASPLPNDLRSGPGAGTPQENLENRYLLAVSYEGLKRYEEALATVRPVVDAAEGQLRADAQLTCGSLLLGLKKYGDAIAPLEAFLAGKPTGDAAVKAAGELAICYARCGQLDKAKKLYAELIEKHGEHPLIASTTEHLAEAAYDANDATWSAELSGRLAAAGDSAQYELKGKLGLGWSQFKAGKLAEAAAAFGEVLDKNPPAAMAAEAALVRGRILDQLGQSEPALAMYGLVIDQHPASPQHSDALLAAAQLRAKLKQNQQAAALYERLAREYPQFPKLDTVLYEWAWALQEVGKPEEADRLFERLRKEHPQSRFWADATYRLAQRAFDAKNYDRANELLHEILDDKAATGGRAADAVADKSATGARTDRVAPQIREYALFLRGQIAVAKTDWPKVRETFETLVRKFPESRRRLAAEFWIAEAFYQEGDYAAAGPRLKRLVGQIEGKREPWMATILLRRAQLLVQQNQWDEAQTIAARIEAEFPDFPQRYEVDYLLGRCLANQADFEGARQAYNKVIHSPAGAKTETAALAQWRIGETFFHQKNYEAAYREYLKVEILYAYPIWQAGALLQAGKCQEKLGDAKQAMDLYGRILKDFPSTTFVGEAAQRLETLKKRP